MLNSVFHIQTSTMPNPTDRRQLTDRQKEALEWVGEGKTAAAIATIMGVAPATVEKHLRLAREALNVETTAQAVLKASMQKHIFSIPITSRCSPCPRRPKPSRQSPFDTRRRWKNHRARQRIRIRQRAAMKRQSSP